ncbi:hypothetical protein IWQ61_003734 [Dispira simplex]|nr:hypothetical protein IWQ61_003734 [Dispira simplex]
MSGLSSSLIQTYRKTRDTGVVKTVREQYIRGDIPCLAECCPRSPQCHSRYPKHAHTSLLGGRGKPYIIPDAKMLAWYIEIFQQPEFENLIFTQTALTVLRNIEYSRTCRILRDIVSDPRRYSVFFYNEIFAATHTLRRMGESLADRDWRAHFTCSQWYRRHLEGQVQVIVLADQEEMGRYRSLIETDKTGVVVMGMEAFLQENFPSNESLLDLFRSLHDAKVEELLASSGSIDHRALTKKTGKLYMPHLKLEELETLVKSGVLYRGVFTVRDPRKDLVTARLATEGGQREREVIIPDQNSRNRAIHNDAVAIRLIPRPEEPDVNNITTTVDALTDNPVDERYYGEVVGILQKNWRLYVATIQQEGDQGTYHLAVPLDSAIPKIRIRHRDVGKIMDQRIVVSIDGWREDSQYPNGHFVRVLGELHNLDAEINAILVERGIATSQSVLTFSAKHLEGLPVDTSDSPWRPTEEGIARRRDLRTTHTVFSIDPPNCEDIDDALSVRSVDVEHGVYELGVHIADVSHFVPAGSLVDNEARARATTVYLADRRFNMLPEVLSERVCSLRHRVDRYAVSILCTIGPTGEIQHTWFGRTVIRSCCEMEYSQAQALLDGDAKVDGLDSTLAERLRPAVRQLMTLLARIRQRRMTNGALELDNTEVKFQFAKSHEIKEIQTKETIEAHRVVEEAMILANNEVGRFLYQRCPGVALLRHHPPPILARFRRFLRAAEAKGLELDVSTNQALAQSLRTVTKFFGKQREIVRLFKTMATMAMMEAGYICCNHCDASDLAHYGLALDFYTHFTSPIRRYADLVVHRQLLAAVEDSSACNYELGTSHSIVDLCVHLNERTRAAKLAQSDSTELFQGLYVYQRTRDGTPFVVEAIISEIQPHGFKAWVPRYGIQGILYWQTRDGQVQVPRSVITAQPGDDEQWIPDATVTSDSATGGCLERVRMHLPGCRPSVVEFELFDRIQVSLKVQPSRSHRQGATMAFIGHSRHASQPRKGVRGKRGQVSLSSPNTPITADAICAIQRKGSGVDQPSDASPRLSQPVPSLYEVIGAFRRASITSVSEKETRLVNHTLRSRGVSESQ